MNNIKQVIYAVYKHFDIKNPFISYHLSKDKAQSVVDKLNAIELNKAIEVRNNDKQEVKFIKKLKKSNEYVLANYIENRYKTTSNRLLNNNTLFQLKTIYPELFIQYTRYTKLRDRLVKLFQEKYQKSYYKIIQIDKIIPEYQYSIKEIEVQD